MALTVPLVLVVVLVAYLCFRIYDFAKYKLPVVGSTLLQHTPEVLVPIVSQSSKSLEKIAPVYQKAIVHVFERDKDLYQKIIHRELDTLTSYLNESAGKATERSLVFKKDLLTHIENHFDSTLSPSDRKIFEESVAQSLYDNLQDEVKQNWNLHLKKVKKISEDIYSISLKTPPPTSKNPQYMVGVGLELLGTKLQEAAK